jgi:hypothetical protein
VLVSGVGAGTPDAVGTVIEMASSDSRRANFPGAAGHPAADYDGFVPAGSPQAESFGPEETAPRYYDEPPYDEAPRSRYGADRHDPAPPYSRQRTSRFLDEESDEDFDEPAPPRSGFLRATAFCLLMALIGSGAGVIWHFYAPDLALPASATDVEKLTNTMGNQTQEQRKLAQTVGALQLGQDALQKALAAREQDIQRLSAEVRALKGDLDNLRSAAAAPRPTPAPHAAVAQVPKRPPNPPPAKKKVERSSVKPEETEPMALSPPQH